MHAIVAASVISVIVAFLPSCATNSGDPTKDARARAVNQTLSEAGTILGQAVVSTLFNVAKQEAQGGSADWQQAAVQGLYANVDVAKTGQAVGRIVSAYSGGKAPGTAQAAQDAFTAVASQDPAKINIAIAGVVSAATGAPVKIN